MNKKITSLNDKLEQMGPIDIYSIFYLQTAEFSFLSSCVTFLRLYHMWHKVSINQLVNIEIIPSNFHDTMTQTEINHNGKNDKSFKYVDNKQEASQ